jgi:outer membrane lipoprotein-sorting protein
MPFQSIRVTLDTRLWLPKSIRLEEPNNDTTEFELSYLTINNPLPEGIFTIDVPIKEMDDPFESHR